MSLRLVTICVVGIVVLSGCLSSTAIQSKSTPDPKSLTEPPRTLSEEGVVDYAETAEQAHLFNERLSRQPTESRLSCDGILGVKTEQVALVYVQCTGGIEFADAPHEDVATWSLYALSNRSVERSSIRDATVRHYDDGSDAAEPDPGYQVVNFDDSPHDISVSLDRDDESPALKFSYDLPPGKSVIQNGLPYEYGSEYEVRVQTTDASEAFVVIPERSQTRLGHGTVLCVLPDGRIVAIRVPPSLPD